MPGPAPSTSCDVTVLGGGLAGKAASLHLARAGLKVVCIEPQQAVRPPVGESLDWSAPDLLNRPGLSPDSLIASRIATWKRHVILKMRDGCEAHYVPSTWLAGTPFSSTSRPCMWNERNWMMKSSRWCWMKVSRLCATGLLI